MTESTDSASTAGTRGRAANLKKRLREDGKQRIDSGKRAAADQIAEIADAIDAAGAQLDQSQPTLASYASKLADGVGGLANHLREDSIEDLYYQVRRLASRHPGMLLLGSAAVGLVLARFMKATGPHDLEASYDDRREQLRRSSMGEASMSEASAERNDPFYRASASPDSEGAEQRGV